MTFFVFRNMTIEQMLAPVARKLNTEIKFSGYEDISVVDSSATHYIWWYLAPYKAEIEQSANQIKQYASLLEFVLASIPSTKTVFAFTITPLFDAQCLTDFTDTNKAIALYNDKIRSLSIQHKNVKIIEFDNFTRQYSCEELVDWKYYFVSQMALNPRLANPFSDWFYQQYMATMGVRKKCLVLDLDNTLWGGILGEDGALGVKIGGDYPGNAYQYFQRYILQLQQQGVILALCSKNNIADVEELWKQQPENLITKQHLAAYRINWQDKATNIEELAKELNIGLESFVFVDDNPTERQLVKEMLPQVTVVDFVEQAYELPKLAKTIASHFKIYRLTDEDKAKTQQYKANAERAAVQSSFANFEDYIRNLGIELKIQKIDESTIERAAQMCQKTNQFNLTTKRYSQEDIAKLINNGAQAWTLGVKDKFGDNGITGLIIVTIENKIATIDTLLMSCRVLGKFIENEFVKYIEHQLSKNGIQTIRGIYTPTEKNSQTADFYSKLDYQKINDNLFEKQIANPKFTKSLNYTIL